MKNSASGNLDTLTPICEVYGSVPATPPTIGGDRVWRSAYGPNSRGVGDVNSDRQSLYFAIPIQLARHPFGFNNISLGTGWTGITMIYQASRQLIRWVNTNDTYWNAQRSKLGMDLFPRTGGPGE